MLFSSEGAQGTYLNDLDPPTARQMGRALGVYLTRESPLTLEPPVVVIAGDGRPPAPEMVAAAAEGIRWSGANLVDIGSATAPCLAFAIHRLRACGGILVGNHPGEVQTVSLQFWSTGPCSKVTGSPTEEGATACLPSSAEQAGPLEAIEQTFQQMPSRPRRRSGSLTRFRADTDYLAEMSHLYHGLRPLRFVLDANSSPPTDYVRRLIGATACEFVPRRTRSDRLAEQIGAENVHFGIRIDQDCERCLVFDQHGRQVDNERLLLLLAKDLIEDPSGRTIVLEKETLPETARRLEDLGWEIVMADSSRAEMHRALRHAGASFGGGPSGRFWYRRAETPAAPGPDQYTSAMVSDVDVRPSPHQPHYAPDALLTLSRLLGLLSQSDRPLSNILDATAPVT